MTLTRRRSTTSIDIYRLAVSIYDHALSTSALGEADADAAIGAFADAYVQTLVGYVGNEKANLFEMTATQAASGHLHSFLKSVEGRAGAVEAQLRHFTAIGADGRRRFVHSAETSLRPATEAELAEFHRRWNAGAYGATLLKVGWHALRGTPSTSRSSTSRSASTRATARSASRASTC